jgi:pimeloyl-ACP methyl ester carboxylesterase
MMNSATSRTLDRPGATVAYDVLERSTSESRPLMLIGQPMDARGFDDLVPYITDRTIITYDPRGAGRSVKADPTLATGPDEHADDLHAVILAAANGGPVDMFASSGGAINSLALVAKYPNDVHTLVAHEPPLASALPDAEFATASIAAIHDTYERSGHGAGMAHFITVTSHRGPMTAEAVAQPAPDPQMFGMSAEDDGNRTDPLLGPSIMAITSYQPDWDAVRASPTRIVLGAGDSTEGQMAHRGAEAVGGQLGSDPRHFPGGHAGFMNSDWEPSDVAGFAAELREIFDSAD